MGPDSSLPLLPARQALQGASPAAIVRRLPEVRPEEARRIVSHVFRGGRLGEAVPTVRRTSVEAVTAAYHVPTLALREARHSALDPFVKFLFETHDGRLVEAVRIPLEKPGRYSVCLSSQVGCALACAYCATGRLGLGRNLEAWELVEQVRAVRASIPAGEGRVHGLVFQGMGEPLANLDRVLDALAVLTEPSALAIDQRTITVCTSGLPAGIRKLATAAPKVRLGLSIGSARPEVRARLMPISLAHPLAEVLDAGVEHARVTGLAPMWALTLLGGVNDSDEDAHALGAAVRDFAARAGLRPRVTFLPYNPIGPAGAARTFAEGEDAAAPPPDLSMRATSPAEVEARLSFHDADPFRRHTPEREDSLRRILAGYGVFPHRRYSGGADVGAACGQLATLRSSENDT